MLNSVVLRGRLVADVELRQAGEYPVTNIRIAVDRAYKKDKEKITDFFNVELWRKQAELARDYLSKGDAVIICGTLETKQWTDKEGRKRTETYINGNSLDFCEPKRKTSGNSSSSAVGPYSGGRSTYDEDESNDADEELPF